MNRLLLALVLGVVTLPSARAHDREDERSRGRPRVILYERADFRGGAITLYPGEAIEDLERVAFDSGRRANDRISSIRVEGGAAALLNIDGRFRGDTLRVTRDVRDLGELELRGRLQSWDDQISSVRVEAPRHDRGPDSGPDRDRHEWRGDPDKIVRRAYQDILERDPDESGLRTYRSRMIDQDWDEQMVRESLRRSDEYRGPVVNRIIGRAYRDVLGREPDASGLEHYRNAVIRQGMTEDELRNDLRRSDEFRNRGAKPALAPTPSWPKAPRREGEQRR